MALDPASVVVAAALVLVLVVATLVCLGRVRSPVGSPEEEGMSDKEKRDSQRIKEEVTKKCEYHSDTLSSF